MSPRLARNFAVIVFAFIGLIALVKIGQPWISRTFDAAKWRTPSRQQPESIVSNPPGAPSLGQPTRPPPEPQQVLLDEGRPCFAFAVSGGKELFMESKERLMAGDHPLNPNILTHVLLPSGESRAVQATAFQSGDPDFNGRDSAYNLIHLQGTRFLVQGKPLEENSSYLLASDAFLAIRTPLKVAPIEGALPPESIPSLEQRKKRKVKKTWALADLGEKGQVYWVIFEPMEGKRALACMVLLAGGAMATEDVLGATDNSQSWREGDDEDSAGEGFSLLYACETSKGLEWAYSWGAEEGESLGYVIQKGDRLEEMPGTHVYRYLEPI